LRDHLWKDALAKALQAEIKSLNDLQTSHATMENKHRKKAQVGSSRASGMDNVTIAFWEAIISSKPYEPSENQWIKSINIALTPSGAPTLSASFKILRTKRTYPFNLFPFNLFHNFFF
jgi:hypothetical protein